MFEISDMMTMSASAHREKETERWRERSVLGLLLLHLLSPCKTVCLLTDSASNSNSSQDQEDDSIISFHSQVYRDRESKRIPSTSSQQEE
jgi:hypothetical protein